MPRARGLSKNVTGDMVWTAVFEARPASLSARQIAAATGLTPNQVATGIRHVREELAAAHRIPLVWSRKGGYVLTNDPAECVLFEAAFGLKYGNAATRLLNGTIVPHIAMIGEDDATAQVINDALGSLRTGFRALAGLGRANPR